MFRESLLVVGAFITDGFDINYSYQLIMNKVLRYLHLSRQRIFSSVFNQSIVQYYCVKVLCNVRGLKGGIKMWEWPWLMEYQYSSIYEICIGNC